MERTIYWEAARHWMSESSPHPLRNGLIHFLDKVEDLEEIPTRP